jgi:hypothetical protein
VTVLLLHLDGKLPNIALMRVAAHYAALGTPVELRQAGNARAVEPMFGDPPWSAVYASLIFERSRPLGEAVQRAYPSARIGGTGWSVTASLEEEGISTTRQDYSVYPRWRSSIGFSQRGCRLRCSFCVVPRKEGAVREEQTIADIWRGDPWPREILLLDNDFFGQPRWQARINELRAGGFKVSFSQGINARMLTDETAAAIASVDYRDDGMRERRIYTAWDNRKDEARLFAGLEALVRHGVKPWHIMVYILVGYWPGETQEDRDYRRARLRDFGALPYPMPFQRTPELLGFQRWVIGGYDKSIPWAEWARARCQPRRLTRRGPVQLPVFREPGEAKKEEG